MMTSLYLNSHLRGTLQQQFAASTSTIDLAEKVPSGHGNGSGPTGLLGSVGAPCPEPRGFQRGINREAHQWCIHTRYLQMLSFPPENHHFPCLKPPCHGHQVARNNKTPKAGFSQPAWLLPIRTWFRRRGGARWLGWGGSPQTRCSDPSVGTPWVGH